MLSGWKIKNRFKSKVWNQRKILTWQNHFPAPLKSVDEIHSTALKISWSKLGDGGSLSLVYNPTCTPYAVKSESYLALCDGTEQLCLPTHMRFSSPLTA